MFPTSPAPSSWSRNSGLSIPSDFQSCRRDQIEQGEEDKSSILSNLGDSQIPKSVLLKCTLMLCNPHVSCSGFRGSLPSYADDKLLGAFRDAKSRRSQHLAKRLVTSHIFGKVTLHSGDPFHLRALALTSYCIPKEFTQRSKLNKFKEIKTSLKPSSRLIRHKATQYKVLSPCSAPTDIIRCTDCCPSPPTTNHIVDLGRLY